MTKQELAQKLKVASYHVDDYAWDVSSDAVLQLVNQIEQSHKHSVVRPALESVSEGEQLATEALARGVERGYPCYEAANCHVYNHFGKCPTCGGYTRGKASTPAAP
jgi:hypothetical protein